VSRFLTAHQHKILHSVP